MTRLSDAQRAAFAADGYLSPLGALPAEEAADLARRLAPRLAADGSAGTGLRNKPHLLLRWVADLVRDPRITGAVEDLLGPDLLILRSVFFVKPPRHPGAVAWHQDVAYWDLERGDRVVSAWIALTDSTVENGCVRVVPGSHREPLLDHRLGRDGDRLVHGQAARADIPPERVACLTLRAGQMSLHDGRLLHSSLGNTADSPRIGLAVRYITPDVRQTSWRPTATLARGVDRFGHYRHEPLPRYDDDPIARAWHARSLRRYALQVLWQAVRNPAPGQLALVARIAARRDALRAMLK